MKSLLMKIGMIVCCIVLVVLACSKSPVKRDDPIQYVTWEDNVWGGPGFEYARCGMATPNGGAIIAGQISDANHFGADGLVLFLDENGEGQGRQYGGHRGEEIWDVTGTDDGGCVTAGWSGWSLGSDEPLAAWFLRLDGSGSVVWETKYEGRYGRAYAFCIAGPSNGHYIAAGYTDGWVYPDDYQDGDIFSWESEEFVIMLDAATGEILREVRVCDLLSRVKLDNRIPFVHHRAFRR